MMKTITLQPKREHSILRRHPWIFSGAVAQVEGNPVAARKLRPLGWLRIQQKPISNS